MELRRLPLAQLEPHPRNPRRIEPQALEGIKASISAFCYVEPIIWNARTGRVVGGHQRLRALEELGRTEAEVVVVDLAETDELALNVALNSRHIAGERSPELAPILDELEGLLGDGFISLRLERLRDDLAEIDIRLDAEDAADVEEDEVPPAPAEPVSRPGDIWVLGTHRLLCGDSTDADIVERLTHGEKASLCFTDPPWNVAYGSSHHPSWKQREIANDDFEDTAEMDCRTAEGICHCTLLIEPHRDAAGLRNRGLPTPISHTQADARHGQNRPARFASPDAQEADNGAPLARWTTHTPCFCRICCCPLSRLVHLQNSGRRTEVLPGAGIRPDSASGGHAAMKPRDGASIRGGLGP